MSDDELSDLAPLAVLCGGPVQSSRGPVRSFVVLILPFGTGANAPLKEFSDTLPPTAPGQFGNSADLVPKNVGHFGTSGENHETLWHQDSSAPVENWCDSLLLRPGRVQSIVINLSLSVCLCAVSMPMEPLD